MKNLLPFIILLVTHIAYTQEEFQLSDSQSPGSEEWTIEENIGPTKELQSEDSHHLIEPILTAYWPPYFFASGTAVIGARTIPFAMKGQNLPRDSWHERFYDLMHEAGYIKKLHPSKNEWMSEQSAVDPEIIERPQQSQNDYANLARYKAANEALPPPADGERRVVFLGNSITEAWVNIDPGFFKDHQFIGRGISGQTSPQLLLRFQQDVVNLQPEVVVIHIGTNDIAENTGPYDPDYTIGNIRSMMDIAKSNDIKVILASVLPASKFEWNKALGDRSDLIIDLNKRIKSLAKKRQVAYIDYHRSMSNANNGMDTDMAEDGVHPTKKGYEIMKGLAVESIQKVLGN